MDTRSSVVLKKRIRKTLILKFIGLAKRKGRISAGLFCLLKNKACSPRRKHNLSSKRLIGPDLFWFSQVGKQQKKGRPKWTAFIGKLLIFD
jgi:hypothetical protein